jgi:hypothetical protein
MNVNAKDLLPVVSEGELVGCLFEWDEELSFGPWPYLVIHGSWVVSTSPRSKRFFDDLKGGAKLEVRVNPKNRHLGKGYAEWVKGNVVKVLCHCDRLIPGAGL